MIASRKMLRACPWPAYSMDDPAVLCASALRVCVFLLSAASDTWGSAVVLFRGYGGSRSGR